MKIIQAAEEYLVNSKDRVHEVLEIVDEKVAKKHHHTLLKTKTKKTWKNLKNRVKKRVILN